jgi:AcrR family transcriptional regulator
VLAAAVAAFGRGGLEGTSTETIARAAGISQPYLFRLFPSKKDLFIAAVRETFARTVTAFEQATGDLSGIEAKEAMGLAYSALLAEPDYLLMQLQAYAACGDADIRVATRRGFRDLWYAVERLSGLDVETLRDFFATGMLLNVVAAMDLPAVDERWAQLVCPSPMAPGEAELGSTTATDMTALGGTPPASTAPGGTAPGGTAPATRAPATPALDAPAPEAGAPATGASRD